jgi:beta-ribofuranosylaminobenzene 5'-phosphate synthase
MTPERDAQAVFVEAPARLHFGVLDLRGARGRWFGGIGAAAPAPTLLVSACPGDTLEVEAEEADRVADFARRFLSHHGLQGGARLCVHRALPQHAGLGSGTQLALAVGRALAELYGVTTDAPGLARAVGRAQRSAVGMWTFAGGGLVVEGGRRRESDDAGPLLARLPFPSTWRCVVAVPHSMSRMSGAKEVAAFRELASPSERDVERVAHLVLMALLPALADADLVTFGATLSAIQAIVGQWFASVQGGTFASGLSEALVRLMSDCGAVGVGQSSWGPTVYGIVDGEEAGARLAARLGSALSAAGDAGHVYWGAFRMDGARGGRARDQPTTR